MTRAQVFEITALARELESAANKMVRSTHDGQGDLFDSALDHVELLLAVGRLLQERLAQAKG